MGPHPGRKKLIVRAVPQPTPRPFKARQLEPAPPMPSKTALQPEPTPLSKGEGPSARQRKRNSERTAARAWLRSTGPHLFGNPPLPLAIGLGKEIIACACAVGFKRYAVGTALHFHVNSHAYLKALAADGAMRRALNGAPVEPVSDEHQADALRRIAEIEAASKARKTP
jgi:ProQ/FINO family